MIGCLIKRSCKMEDMTLMLWYRLGTHTHKFMTLMKWIQYIKWAKVAFFGHQFCLCFLCRRSSTSLRQIRPPGSHWSQRFVVVNNVVQIRRFLVAIVQLVWQFCSLVILIKSVFPIQWSISLDVCGRLKQLWSIPRSNKITITNEKGRLSKDEPLGICEPETDLWAEWGALAPGIRVSFGIEHYL